MKDKLYLAFALLDTDIKPKEISILTKITPEIELEKGERNRSLSLPRQNVWSIRSKTESDELKDHWQELAPILYGAKEEIMKIAQTGRAVFTIVINNNKRIPSIMITPDFSTFAGYISAIIDIDHIQF